MAFGKAMFSAMAEFCSEQVGYFVAGVSCEGISDSFVRCFSFHSNNGAKGCLSKIGTD
jgi:hypothetical protein